MKIFTFRKTCFFLAVAAVLFSILLGLYSRQSGWQKDLDLYSMRLQQETELFNRGLNQLTSISKQLTHNPLILNILNYHNQQKKPTRIAALMVTKTLESIAMIENISAAYLMDMKGNCIYSSEPSFVGHNYGFRPYFQAALQDSPILYTAIEVTSNKLGIFYARPVIISSHAVGVAVIKIRPSFFNISWLSTAFTSDQPAESNFLVGLLTESGIFINIKNQITIII